MFGSESFSSFKQQETNVSLENHPTTVHTAHHNEKTDCEKLREVLKSNSDPSSSNWSSDDVERRRRKQTRRKKNRNNEDVLQRGDDKKRKRTENERQHSPTSTDSSHWSSADEEKGFKETSEKRKKKKRHRSHSPQSDDDDSENDHHQTSDRTHRDKKKKKKKKKKKMKKKLKREQEENEKEPLEKKPDTLWLEETNLNAEDAYRKDGRPDMHNFQYGSLYKMDIANFVKPVKLTVLGLSKHQEVCLYSKKKKKKNKQEMSQVRYFLQRGTMLDNDESGDTDDFIHTLESEAFIPIKKNRDVVTSAADTNDEIKTTSEDIFRDNYHLQQNRIFSQKLLDNPQDVKTWIEFVDAQNELFPWSHDNNEEDNLLKRKENWLSSKALCEKKVSILEKALMKNPASVDLVLRHMRLVKDLWSPKDVKEKWKKLLFQFPNRSVLWLEYLTFVQTDLIGMTVTKVLEAYRKCFMMLLSIHRGIRISHKPEVNSVDGLLMVLVHLLLFLWQSGLSYLFVLLVCLFLVIFYSLR